MSKLFTPYRTRGVELKNRIVMSPMCQYSAKEDGVITDWHRVHYPARAQGGAGLIVVEATAVEPQGRISARDLGLWDERQKDGLRELVQLIHFHGAKAAIQLAHAGRKATVPGEIVAPSPLAFSDQFPVPKALEQTEIRQLVMRFQHSALLARQAGFDIIEIHAAHGYLINQFLSPLTNQRDDEYGGTPENRFRFLREIVLAVREGWDGPLWVRFSAEEYAEGGNHVEDTVRFARWCKELGIDLIDVSSGGVVPFPIHDGPGYQVPFAARIKQEAEMDTGAVGLITDPQQAEEILEKGQADLIFLGRELLRNPYWPIQAALKLGDVAPVPTQYSRAF